MWFVWGLLSSLIFAMSGFLMKTSSVKRGSVIATLFGLYLSGTLGFAGLVVWQGQFRWDWAVLVAGIIVGFGSAAGNWLFMVALEKGPASLTSPLVNTNILLIILFSTLFYGERLTFMEWTGVGLLLLAVLCIPIDPDEELAIRDKKWYAVVIGATLLFTFRNGGLKVTEELGMTGEIVLFYSYLLGLIWFSFELWRKGRNTNQHAGTKAMGTGIKWGLLAGIFSFAGMQLYTVALIEGPASIVAPLFATNSLVVALLSILFFKERLSSVQKISLIFLFIGLVLTRIS
ncbi:DMT family transporter [Kroppenstedtia pulmonis]|uniref:DMT family transporter n=1 Tax=Kroppenstedtia pulmonis TaxID=1380685 RepID=A0A7D3XQN3_9BACL|nr:DMT family transporter [Kroppenstedtia pulmonis]QKG83588.1 DMT family transporter [Kroppenstedtia pulmonis]